MRDSAEFIKKNGMEDYYQLKLTNIDGKHSVSLLIGKQFDYRKYLLAYCRVRGYKIGGRDHKNGILVTDISLTDPEYDFDNDPQFNALPLGGLDDLLSLFPTQHLINNREAKQKSLLFSLVGGQEKTSTKGGVGVSILSPDPKKISADKLVSKVAAGWYPYCTRGRVSTELPSFLSGYGGNVIRAVSGNSRNFLRYKINRELLQEISKLRGDLRVLDALLYSHSYVYLDEGMDWLEGSNIVDMLLLRARMKRVSVSEGIMQEAKEREKKLNERFYEDFNSNYKCPEAILDVAECIAKINGKGVVSVNELKHAEDLIYSLRKESADELGVHADLFSPQYIEKTGPSRIVYNLVGYHKGERTLGEIKQMALDMGVKEATFNAVMNQLIYDGEVYEDRKDGMVFPKLTSEFRFGGKR